ncbi:efflux RND transporter periplasmic adaptor subunit [Rhodoplanes serenus]|uniref:Efflux RND transporter periplasmic adaptor subunit n=1 Tax=Rhodoplanes serenus TaxID=200615 RepID=A0A9X5AU87_9BRAD|nr:efflux RND transporter periplasmic adaptor subunit [Rhodoplanes serenus]MTW19201.1 efflux RND transporter periplasmic adaptor subunit [Rhodoplanes serenus]
MIARLARTAVLLLLLAAATDPPPSALASEPAAAPARRGDGAPTLVPVGRGIVDIEGGLVQIAAPRDGVIRDVLVEEGQMLKADAPLAVLDDRPATHQLDIARAQLEERRAAVAVQEARLAAARRERDRIAPLVGGRIVSQKTFDLAASDVDLQSAELQARRAEVTTAEAQVRSAAYELALRTIRAPADGVVVRRMVRPGDGVSTLNVTPLFLFAPGTPRIVRAEIEELFLPRLAAGQRAEIAIENATGAPVPGRLIRIGQAFGPRRATAYEPRDRVDVRVLEVVIGFEGPAPAVPLGQRVVVRFPP